MRINAVSVRGLPSGSRNSTLSGISVGARLGLVCALPRSGTAAIEQTKTRTTIGKRVTSILVINCLDRELLRGYWRTRPDELLPGLLRSQASDLSAPGAGKHAPIRAGRVLTWASI